MNKIVLLLLVFVSQVSFAQEQSYSLEDPVFETKDVDVEPNFPSGMDGFYKFIEANFKEPEVPQLIGKLFISFIVEKDGSLSDIRTIKDVGFGTGIEAERVMQLSPRWSPGTKAGKTVRVLFTVAIPIQTK